MSSLLRVAVATATAGCILVPAPSGAASLPSFTGSCTFAGIETFTPPLTLNNRPGAADVAATGRCSGKLADPSSHTHSVTNAAATYHQATTAPTISCVAGTARGTGVLTIDGTALNFSITEPQLTVLSTLHYAAQTWSGSGIASVAPSADPLTLALACLTSGITKVPVLIAAYLHAP